MRILALLAMFASMAWAASGVEVVRPAIAQMDGGPSDPPGFERIPGSVLYFSCRVANFAKNSEQKIRIAYSVQAFDPKGLPLAEIYKNEINEEVLPQDKEWQPKIATELMVPPLAPPGEYKVVVTVEDLVNNTKSQSSTPFKIRARTVEPSDSLVIRNFNFYRAEDDSQPVGKGAFRVGDELWAKFDIVGFKYAAENAVDVNYVVSILSNTGAVLWTQPEPAAEKSKSFYPKPYVPAVMNLSLKTVKPATYTMRVKVMDAVGGQSYETKQDFTVQ
jgi:hypothetical protein